MSLSLESTLQGHSEDRVWHISWAFDSTHLASCGEDKVIRIWSIHDKKWICICTLEEGTQTRTIRCCEWSPDGKKIASASFCGVVAIWEAQSPHRNVWDQIASLEGHENEVKSVSWSYDGSFLASCGRDKKIWLWECVAASEFECACILEGHTQDVKCVKWSSREHSLFSASYDDTVRMWTFDGEDWFCQHTFVGHSSTVWGLSLCGDNRLLSCSDDLTIICWSIDRKVKLNAIVTAHSQPVYSIDYETSYNYLASGAGDNSICLYSVDDGANSLMHIYSQISAHAGDVNCVRWNNSSGKLLASCGDDGLIKIWSLNKEEIAITKEDTTIRAIRQIDNAAIAAIIRESLEERKLNLPGTAYFDSSTDHLFEVSQSQGSTYFILTASGVVVGGCGITTTEGLPSHTCELIRLFVAPSFRNKGLGAKLLEKCIEFSKQNGYKAIYLETLQPLIEAIALYRKRGFRHLDEPLVEAGCHYACDVWMLLVLE